MVENEIQQKILSLCSFFANGGTYSQLKPKDVKIDSDLYNYHLKFLVSKGYLTKENKIYKLTEAGKSLVTNIDHLIKAPLINYKVSIYLMPVVKGKILLYKRLKHPQYGYTGLISGKIKQGENILQTAEREFNEETSLSAKFKIIGNLRQIRRNLKGDLIEDGVFYICFTDKVNGALIENGLEGNYFWIDINKVSTLEKIFKPSLEICVKEVIDRLKGKVSWDNKFIYELEPKPEEY